MVATLTKSKLHATSISLNIATREAVLPLLQQALFTTIDMKWRLKQAHWNVKGSNFIALHELFDELATEQDAHADELAERMTALGGHPLSDIREVAKHSPLKVTPLEATTPSELLKDLAYAYAAMGEQFRQALDESEKVEDAVTADLFTGMAGTLDMRLWFIEAHLAS